MNKKLTIILAALVGALVIGGGVWALTASRDDKKSGTAMHDDTMMHDDEAMSKDGEMMHQGDAMGEHGSYITLADYKANPDKYKDSKKVYFFHAKWCPDCRAIDKAIVDDPGKLPAGVTFIKTDYDDETELRQKYGVTVQYTFVQVDNDGNQIAKWTEPTLEGALAGIKS